MTEPRRVVTVTRNVLRAWGAQNPFTFATIALVLGFIVGAVLL